jgi:DNA-binding NtrC family response regulator
MESAAHVLIYGRDPYLLETRRQVLRRGGFQVRTIAELAEFSPLQAHEFKVFVLCHTLDPKQQQEAISVGRQANHTLRTIVMTAFAPEFTLQEGSYFLSPFEGPEALIALVRAAA